MTKLIMVLALSLFLSGCTPKPTPTPTPTPAPKTWELLPADKPLISLIPRTDGHELKLKIEKIPTNIKEIEYELLYTAVDNNLEIEKGAGDTLKSPQSSIERNILLGTSSCTNGCKYKYDTGVTGGTLSLTLVNQNGQFATFQTPFTLKTGKEIKKQNSSIGLPTENYSQKVTNPKPATFYLLLKNFGGEGDYSLFDSGSF